MFPAFIPLACLLLLQVDAPSPAQLQQWIRQLGDPQLAARNEATEKLWLAGDASSRLLEAALNDADLEIVTRARYVLDRIRAGIIPGADPEVTKAVEQFRFGDGNAKRQAISTLLKKGEIDRIRWLIDREPDPKLRDQFNVQLQGDLLKQTADKIVAGDEAGALALLEEIHRRGGSQHLAAYLHLAGQGAARVATLRESANLNPSTPDGQLLWHLSRMEGDFAGARKLAESANNPVWKAAVANNAYDWQSLLSERTRAAPSANADVLSRIQYWGSVAVLRRAGNSKSFEEARQKLLDLREAANDQEVGRLAETLVLLGERKQAEDMLAGRRRVQLAELLSHQGRYAEAFAALALHDPRGGAVEWFNSLDPNDPRLKIQDPVHPFHAGRLAARMLHLLGEREPSLALFDALAKIGADDAAKKYALLNTAKAEWDLGIDDQAEQHASQALVASDARTLFGMLYPRSSSHAQRWYAHLAARHPNDAPAKALRTVRQLLSSAFRPRLTDDAWKAVIDEAASAVEGMNEKDRSAWRETLAETCVIRGKLDQALEFFRAAAAGNPSSANVSLLKVGDVCFQLGRWSDAVDAYDQAFQLDRTKPLPRYLQGIALIKSVKKDEGDMMVRQARLLPLGNPTERHALAGALKDRGLRQAAGDEYDLETRLSLFDDLNVFLAGQELAQLRGGADPAWAANFWQAFIAKIIEISAVVDRDGALRLPQNVHRLKAAIHLAEKRHPEALAELRQAQEFVPHDVELTLTYLPKFADNAQASALFDRAYEANAAILEQFPNAALYHNNLAWLAARSARRLDDALEHAKRAVELRPDYVGYLDTLAEVYFQRGDRDEAVKLEKRCLELEPANTTFKQQIERFEKGEPGPVKN